MRTLMFTPGDNKRRMQRALTLPADAVVYDLEDGVAATDREAARSAISDVVTGRTNGPPLYVRPNRLSTVDGLRDVLALAPILPRLDGVLVPMVEEAHEVRQMSQLLDELRADIDILVGVETPLGIENLYEMLIASPKVVAVVFGGGDYAAKVGTGLDFEALLYARSRVAATAGQVGVPALDVPYVDVRDPEGLAVECRRVRGLGFVGKVVIHPDQVQVVNQAFAPSDEDIAWARRVVAAAQGSGHAGAFSIDGRLVDRPIILRCEQILASAPTES